MTHRGTHSSKSPGAVVVPIEMVLLLPCEPTSSVTRCVPLSAIGTTPLPYRNQTFGNSPPVDRDLAASDTNTRTGQPAASREDLPGVERCVGRFSRAISGACSHDQEAYRRGSCVHRTP